MDAEVQLLPAPVSGLNTLSKDRLAELANTTSEKDAEWIASALWLTHAVVTGLVDNPPIGGIGEWDSMQSVAGCWK